VRCSLSPLWTSSNIVRMYIGTASPLAYFTNTSNRLSSPQPRILGHASTRSLPRSSDVDFDSVPSPRAASSRFARDQANGRAGPSNLSKSSTTNNDEEDVDMGGGDGEYDPPENDGAPTPSRSQAQRTPRRRASFSALDQDPSNSEEEV